MKKLDASMATAIAAGIVSISALTVSVYEAYLQRQEQRVAVWPIVEHWTSYSDDEFSISVANKGIGPAVIHDLDVFVAGQSMTSWDQVFGEALGDNAKHFRQSMLTGNVMSPGDASAIVAYTHNSTAAWHASKNIELRICYCSVFQDCWLYQVNDLIGGRPARNPTTSCIEQPGDQF